MATVIDSLVVELGLDPSKFTAGQREAMDAAKKLHEESISQAKAIESQGKKTEDFFKRLKSEAVGLVGAFFGAQGIKEFVQYVTTLDAATGRLAKTIGLTTGQLSSWQGVAQLSGGTAEGMASSLQNLNGMLVDLQLTGNVSMLPFFNLMRISLKDANGQFKTTTELMLEMSDWAKSQDADRAATVFRKMGFDQGTINMLLLGRTELERLRKEQEALGHSTKENSDRAIELSNAWARASQAAVSFGRSILSNVSHPMAKALDLVTRLFVMWRTMGILPGSNLTRPGASGEAGPPAPPASPSAPWRSGSLGVFGLRSRADRNNNPGNIEYGPFAKAHGATGSDGRFAIFPSPESGAAAMEGLLAAKYSGLSLEQIQRKWVGNADSNYLLGMMRSTGLGAQDVPNLADAGVRHKLALAMSRGEGSHVKWDLGTTPGAGVSTDNSRTNSTSTSNSHVTIGQVSVNAPGATDAQGIAQELPGAVRRANWAASANYGQQ